MDSKSKAIEIVFAAIDALNEQLPADRRLPKQESAVLLGSSGKLDSVAFVNMIVLLEESCQEKCNLEVSLTEDAPGGEADPFRTVGTLILHISNLIEARTPPQPRH